MILARRMLMASAAALALVLGVGAARAAEEIEVVHWWTSGGEAAAVGVLKENLEKEGVTWKDSAIAGGGGQAARTALQARLAAGDPPGSMQMLGTVIHDYAAAGDLGDLTDLATKEGWDKVVPAPLQWYMTYDGKWVAAPVNIHSTNWLWINKALLEKVGGTAPTTFDEFVALAEKFKAAGITPVAHGGQPWQDATIFDGAVVSAGGPDFYKKAFIDLDEGALTSDTMKNAFKQLRTIRGYVDPNFSGRDWNLATAMVINGEAGMQIMGDWAKGEWVNAGKTPGVDVVCVRYPGTQGTVTFNSDAFAMFQVKTDAQKDAQTKLAMAIMDPKFQEQFNIKKGSVPARTDVPGTNFDACGQKGIADVKEAVAAGSMLGSMAHGHAASEAVKGAVYDVVTEFFNSDMSEDDAVQKLAQAVNLAK